MVKDWIANLELATIGFIGAAVAVLLDREHHGWRAMLPYLAAGAAAGQYCSGLIVTYFSISPENIGGISFLLGAFGGSMIVTIARTIREADIVSVIKSRFGGGSNG